MTADHLRELLETLESITMSLHEAFKKRDEAENQYKIAKSNLQSLVNQRDLVREKIMAEKILIKEIR